MMILELNEWTNGFEMTVFVLGSKLDMMMQRMMDR